MRCGHCGNQVPEGVFCTRCGAHQGTTGESGDPRAREHRFAAHPGEHVAHPGVFTTLFPHLGHHKVHEFRWAFVVGLAGLVVFYVAGLIIPALLLAAFLVPVLYLVYLYEAQVYRHEPVLVMGLTLGGGIVMGTLVTLVGNAVFNPVTIGGAALDAWALVVLAVALPFAQEVLKPIPALLLRGRARFEETVDGLAFGVAAGLGFSLAETLIRFSGVVMTLPAQTDPQRWIFPLLSVGVLLPLLQGSATGAIVAALWKFRGRRPGVSQIGAMMMAVVAHVAFVLGGQILQDQGFEQLVVLAWQGLVVAALLIYIRYLLHHALLQEAAHMGFRETVCINCHRHVVASGFCPSCGMALTASPASAHPRRGLPPGPA